MVNFFENFRKNFSAPSERGARTAAGGFALTGRLLSLHRLNGVRELPQAGSPLTGGKFFAEPQRGIRRLRTAGTCRAPRRGKRVDTKVSTLLTPTSFGGGSGADYRHVTAAKRSTAEEFFYRMGAQCAPISRHIRSARYRSATHTVYSAQSAA